MNFWNAIRCRATYCRTFEYKNLAWVLIILALIVGLTLSIGTTALAYTPVVDGAAIDWAFSLPPSENLGHIVRNANQEGVFAWIDASGDERTDFASPDSGVDLIEFQITGDQNALYVMAKMADIDLLSGEGAPQIQIAIDTDQVSSSGESQFAGDSNTQVHPDAEWEYLVGTRFGSGNRDLIVWENDFMTQTFTGTAEISAATDLFEAMIPWSALGIMNPPTGPLRISVAIFRSGMDDRPLDINGTSDALDVITNYGDPGDIVSNTWADVSDGVLNYYFDLFFEPDGDVYAPLVISEVLYDPSGSEPGAEFVEISNISPVPIDLSSYKIGDEETIDGGEGMRQFPSGGILSSGVIVWANHADTFTSTYGFLPDYANTPGGHPVPTTNAYSAWANGSLNLSNSGDEVILVDGCDTIIDVVEYDDPTPEWPGMSNTDLSTSNGESLERFLVDVDTNDMEADFVIRSDDGTPGVVARQVVSVASGNWTSPDTWDTGYMPDLLDKVTITTGTAITVDSDAICDELVLEESGALLIPDGGTLNVETALTNNGLLRQTHTNLLPGVSTPFLNIQSQSGESRYFGVDVHPSGNTMEEVTVQVLGNRECTTLDEPGDTVNRCFDISASGTATVTFHFLQSELDGLDFSHLEIWHWDNPGWSLAGSVDERGIDGQHFWIRAIGIDNFSPFVLKSGGAPSAVTLKGFSTRPETTTDVVWVLFAVVSVIFIWGVVRKRRVNSC